MSLGLFLLYKSERKLGNYQEERCMLHIKDHRGDKMYHQNMSSISKYCRLL